MEKPNKQLAIFSAEYFICYLLNFLNMASFIETESQDILEYYYDPYNKVLKIKSMKSIIKIYIFICI